MTMPEFDIQMARIRSAFGKTHLGNEQIKLIWKYTCDLKEEQMIGICDNFISKFHKCPLPADFLDAGHEARKKEFKEDLRGATEYLYDKWPTGLKAYLAKEFPGCNTLNEAVEVRRLQIKIKKAEDPSYDPMTDPKWT